MTFLSRTLKPNENNYVMVEEEALALHIISDVRYVMLVLREIKVLTRYLTLAWLVESPGINRRMGRWAVLPFKWTLQVRR